MEPISYVDALNSHYGSMGFPPYQWTVNDSAPLTRISKPLSECRVSMLTSGGVSHCSMPGFDPDARNDHRLDPLAENVSSDDFDINDSYYDHRDAESDLNCVFPIDRLRELADAGVIGSIAARFWSGFMGRIYNRTKVIEESAPAFVEKLRADAVDILVAAPAWPLDHQTVGLVCRVVEEAGIATVCLSTGRDLTLQVQPPRSLFVNYPMGNNFGKPADINTQTRILTRGLRMIHEVEQGGVLIDWPEQWHESFAYFTGQRKQIS